MDDFANIGTKALTLLAGTGPNTDIVGGGMAGQVDGALQLQDSSYFIGGINLSLQSSFTVGSSGQIVPETFVVNNGMTVSSAGTSSMSLASGTYYLSGAMTGGTVTGWGLTNSVMTTRSAAAPIT